MVRVAITGRRKISPRDEEVIWQTMGDLVADPDVDAIYFGGALGADTRALQAARVQRGMKLKPKLIVICPDKVSGQPVEARRMIEECADDILELCNRITPENGYKAYKDRDDYLVQKAQMYSGYLVAFWEGSRKGGTFYTVDYAERQKVPVVVVDIDGENG